MEWQKVDGLASTLQLEIDQVANTKSILDIQPTSLKIRRPLMKEDESYLRYLHRLVHVEAYTSDLFGQIETPIACFEQLKTLVVIDSDIEMSESSAMAFGQSLKQFTQLTKLKLQCNGLGDMLPNIIPFMADLTLQHLELDSIGTSRLNRGGIQKMVYHLSTFTQLEHLCLSNLVNGEDKDCVKGLCELISSLPHLTVLQLPLNVFNSKTIHMLCDPISQLSGLTHLDLSGSTLDERSMKALGVVVTHLPLIHLELGDTTWERGGWDAFLDQFNHWPHLKALNLSHREKIDTEPSTYLAVYLSALSKLSSLVLLDIRCYQPDAYQAMLIPLKSLPLQVLFMQAPPEGEATLKQTFPSKCVLYQGDDVVVHDTSLPTLSSYADFFDMLFPKKPVVETTPASHTQKLPDWAQFESFKHINKNQLNTYLMQPMLYHHFRYPEQACLLWTQQDWDVSFLESILLNELPTPEDMNTALKYHRWSEIVGYNPGLIHYGDYIQQHLTVDNLVSTFVCFHNLKKTVLPQRDVSGEHVESTGEEDELVCWDGLLSYLVSKWSEWYENAKEQLLYSGKGCSQLWLIQWKGLKPLQCEWAMKEEEFNDWIRRTGLFKATQNFLHLSPSMRPDMTVVINNASKVLHLHSHVVWKRWAVSSSQLQSRARLLGKMSDQCNVIYHLELSADLSELVECLMEYCYTGDVAKLAFLTPYQIESIGKMNETTIYSMAALLGGPLEADPKLADWREHQLVKRDGKKKLKKERLGASADDKKSSK